MAVQVDKVSARKLVLMKVLVEPVDNQVLAFLRLDFPDDKCYYEHTLELYEIEDHLDNEKKP